MLYILYNSKSCIGYNFAFLLYKFNCMFIEHSYIVKMMCRSILDDTDNVNLNVLIYYLLDIRVRNKTLEFTDEDIMSMIKDITVH